MEEISVIGNDNYSPRTWKRSKKGVVQDMDTPQLASYTNQGLK